MPARFLLIDGYNLLHAAGMGRQEYGPGDLQRCRERLLRYLTVKLTAAEISRATVIFDARDPPRDRPAEQTFRKLQILFANPGGDADVRIEQWLDDHSAPKRVTLVSSDHALQRAARRRRAQFVDSEQFFEQLERRRNRGENSARGGNDDAKPGGAMTDAMIAHWMREFGDVSCEPESAAPPAEAPAQLETPRAPAAQSGKRPPTTKRRGKRKPAPDATEEPNRIEELERWLKEFEKGSG